MATVDELIIQIRADTKDLERKLDRVKGKTKGVGATGQSSFQKLGASLKKLRGPAIAAAAAIAGIAVAITKVAKIGMEFEDLQSSLNAVFKSAKGGEAAFGRILEFAQTTPFQIEDVTKAFIQLKSAGIEPNAKMLQTFADTASVAVDSLGAFEALVRITQRSAGGGLGLEELEQLSDRGIPVYKILSERMNISRLDIAEIGKTAAGSAKIMTELVAGMEEAYGGTMAAKMGLLSTKTSNLQIAFKQLANVIFQEGGLGAALKSATDDLTRWVTAATNAARAALTGVPVEIRGQSDPKEAMRLAEEYKAALLKRLHDPTVEESITDFGKKLVSGLVTALDYVPVPGSGVAGWMIERMVGKDPQAAIGQIEQFMTDLQAVVDQGAKDAEASVANAKRNEQLAILAEKLGVLRGVAGDMLTPLQEVNAQIKVLNELLAASEKDPALKATLIGIFGSEEQLDKALGFLDAIQAETAEVAETFSETMAPAIANLAHSFTNDFVNALMTGKSALESFKSFAKNIVSQIISTFMQMAVVNEILNAIFGTGGMNIKGWVNQPTISGPVAAPGTNPPVVGGGRQSGGTVGRGRPYLVGESGPELFVPNIGGVVRNSHDTRNSIGGQSVVVNQNINLSTGVSATVRAEVGRMLPQISDMTKAAVLEAAVRGGAYGKALRGGA